MANSAGEMPFLDHLEELRKRILLSLLAIIIGFCIGWWVTTHFNLIQVVEAPIAPFIPGGKLTVLAVTDSFMIVLQFAFILGAVLASPFVIYQVWLFLSPALTTREKKAILPSLGIGFLLFMGGAALGWFYVVGPAVAWLLNFQAGSFNALPTYNSYMTLVIHLLLGMGISAELPLVMILLASLGIMSVRIYTRFRRFAVLGAFIGGAILAPTPEVTMMILFTIPLLLLYEVGVFGAWIVEKRKARAARIAAGVLLLVLCFSPRGLHAQIPPPVTQQKPPGALDTLRGVTGKNLETADAARLKRLGLPAGPSVTFAAPDSIMQALLAREGFATTRFHGDSVRYVVSDERIVLGGHAATLREDSRLEADQIVYDNPACKVLATGSPRMFQKGPPPTTMIGTSMALGICDGAERGVIQQAYTSLANGGTNWFVRGNIAADSGAKRVFVANSEFTSCDLPDPHYHFTAGEMKWVSQSVIVARPAVLYIRDVPVAWLPFIFQDTKRDRSSGILIPRFGVNDIVRTNRNYNRNVSNIGYYWAPNDYIDVTAHLDWYANRYVQYGGNLRYRLLDRFINGSLSFGRQIQSDGNASNTLHWDHSQDFSVTTKLNLYINYQSDSRVQLNNAIDPLASTALISSSVNFSKRLRIGTLTIGGTRSEALGTGAGQMTLPTFSFQPKPVRFGPVLWSPGISGSSATSFNQPLPVVQLLTPLGIDSLAVKRHDRRTQITFPTPFTFGKFNWQNQLNYTDEQNFGRVVTTERVWNGTDSVTRTTIRGGDFKTGLDWQTSLNLPLIAQGTWKITPSIGVTNAASGPFLLRSPGSGGAWVAQGKKVQLGLDAVPTFFAFTNFGVGPFQKLRWTIAPQMSLHYSPAASVSAEYAKALGAVGGLALTDIPATASATMTLHQTIEGKMKPLAGDTISDPTHLPKVKILSLQSSTLEYDFKQAGLPGRTGWRTSVMTNSFASDLIPALTVSVTHSLWEGDVGSDTARFSPFLAQASASLNLTGGTFKWLGHLIGLGHKDTLPRAPGSANSSFATPIVAASSFSPMRPGGGYQQAPTARGFSAGLTYSLQRYRPNGTTAQQVSTEPAGFGSPNDPFGTGSIIPVLVQPAQSQLGINLAFAPTPFWSVTWRTQYDISKGTFLQQQIDLQRDLHDWKASFSFTKNTNGNFALYFTVFLVNLPDIKFDYNQSTLQQARIQP